MEARINRRKNKETGEVTWVIQKRSVLMHHEQCPSIQKLSARELADQLTFRRAVKKGRTSRKKLAEAGRELKMCMGNVEPWTLYRARNKVMTPTLGQYTEDFKKLEQWQAEFVFLNNSSRISDNINVKDNTFVACFLTMSQMIWANYKCGLGFHAVDTCHSYHPIYTGKLWVLCSRDSDNKICILAYALTPSEDKDSATQFGEFCAVGDRLQSMLSGSVLYTDGGPALPAFAEYFDAAKQNRCFQHLIG